MKKMPMFFEVLPPVTRRNYGFFTIYGKIMEGGNTDLRKEKVMYDDLNNKSGETGLSSKFDASSKPTMTVDVDRYQAYLDGSNMSEAEKEERAEAAKKEVEKAVKTAREEGAEEDAH